MGIFSGLSDRLNHIFSKLAGRGKLTELEIKQAMREVRVALLEADVNLFVAKDFIAKVSEKAVGQEILKSLTPAQQVIKIVRDELVELMGSTNAKRRRICSCVFTDTAMESSLQRKAPALRPALPGK